MFVGCISYDQPVLSEAKTKAAAYAAGVEARLGRLLALAELEHGYGRGMQPMAARAAGSRPDMPVAAGEQQVVASIHATFELVES